MLIVPLLNLYCICLSSTFIGCKKTDKCTRYKFEALSFLFSMSKCLVCSSSSIFGLFNLLSWCFRERKANFRSKIGRNCLQTRFVVLASCSRYPMRSWFFLSGAFCQEKDSDHLFLSVFREIRLETRLDFQQNDYRVLSYSPFFRFYALWCGELTPNLWEPENP